MLLEFNKCWFIGSGGGRRHRTTIQIFWRMWYVWRIHDAGVWCSWVALVRASQICEVKRVAADRCHCIKICALALFNYGCAFCLRCNRLLLDNTTTTNIRAKFIAGIWTPFILSHTHTHREFSNSVEHGFAFVTTEYTALQ